ncbi:type I-F CRISPR-associated helicase Cas3f [Vibrio crassostreae]|uniref:type I-F CRISPR-associated helicase Cas3f n=1 Tax=Vibrio crassostreae TaxID=246167 RepID=UPI001B30FB23|nr:type I-F CRISPR-associated helicase Cas3f [Vibrio crassostreae]
MKETSYSTEISALFHDIGKSGKFMQTKLRKNTVLHPYSHEWVSLKIFEAVVGDSKLDRDWLERLASQQVDDEFLESALLRGGESNLFKLPPFAQLIGWLIVSHHSIPHTQSKFTKKLEMESLGRWKECYNSGWNSEREDWGCNEQQIEQNWSFPDGTLFSSSVWRQELARVCLRALKDIDFKRLLCVTNAHNMHVARTALVLADHLQSAKQSSPSQANHDKSSRLRANTTKNEKGRKVLNQYLDEHCIGVAEESEKIVKQLYNLRPQLPNLDVASAAFEAPPPVRFKWQQQAFEAVRTASKKLHSGAFIVNIASTGEGKTIINPRLLYAVNKKAGFRITTAIGLRTLTMQTASEYTSSLKLDKDLVGVKIGGETSFELNNNSELHDYNNIDYDGVLPDFVGDKLSKLVAPAALCCTIDHLIAASDTLRGGRQVAPILRLLSSDLVLDEPDDFSINDYPALVRLAYFAGLMGSNIILSSATLTPAQVNSMYQAYEHGVNERCRANNQNNNGILSATLSEYATKVHISQSVEDFKQNHLMAVNEHSKEHSATKHKLDYLQIESTNDMASAFAGAIAKGVKQLHNDNHNISPCGKRVSFGVVRISHINSLCRIVQRLLDTNFGNLNVKFCIYHSQFPSSTRGEKEKQLNAILNRKNDEFWSHGVIKNALKNTKEDCAFIVVGTPVVEVGQDHDYDWAIAELASVRSLMQLKGRVKRHRTYEASNANLLVLEQNVKTFKGKQFAFKGVGYETNEARLTPNLSSALLNNINSLPCELRLKDPSFTKRDFVKTKDNKAHDCELMVKQEHRATRFACGEGIDKRWMFSFDVTANDILHADAIWNAEVANRTSFRASSQKDDYILSRFDGVEDWALITQQGFKTVSCRFEKMTHADPSIFFASHFNNKKEDRVSLYKNKQFFFSEEIGVFS